MIKAVIFDLDNTLVDFMAMKEAAVEAAVAAMIDAGLKISHEEAKEKIYKIYDEEGIEDQKVFDKFLIKEFGGIDYRIHAAGIIGYRRAREAALVLYPHVQLTLMELIKRGLKLAVVSDAPRLQAWLRLCQLNLHHIFDVVITFEDTNKRKPDPEPFKKALHRLNIEPEEAMMVGDWVERDIVGAKSLGMKTVFARYGDRFRTTESGADYEVDDVLQILEILDNLSK
ncbi:MAG TPA: TIGR02253 family HAD-type hydrolase [candidate division WOR-3 bacterium]|uniref:Glyceraldehyde 3-phosphate phosphatase n=1 Tax=candidate division WOR-3 bacterium TaxID=2052148 RepID=A0A9C9K0Q9_UNCW3|nr:TIGR02253 family HAD-type hydrolase [candidate division WOR-3 bacterium]